MARIATFDDWADLFHGWLDEIGIDDPAVRSYTFEAKYGELPNNEIQFGGYAGRPRWEKAVQIPDQRIADALLNLIVYQGDTEFASVEQQRRLFATAPSDYDRRSFVRVMTEEARHGWQMAHILVTQFGSSGRVEAEKLLQRRAFNQDRLLGTFNIDIETWTDFFIYTQFIDRDGKFQLNMLSTSAFAPLARSAGPMLREESFHLGTGTNGLTRLVQANKLPRDVLQRCINKWISSGHDLFGTDHSSSARWAYEWGIKGRYDEAKLPGAASKDLNNLNDLARQAYHEECQLLVDRLNHHSPAGAVPLTVPDIRFNRRIGQFAGQRFSADGTPLSESEYEAHLRAVLPSATDVKLVKGIEAAGGWIAPKGAEAG